MSDQIKEEISDPKARLKEIEEKFREHEFDFIVDPEIDNIERFMMEYAEHPDQVKEFFNVIAESISIEKLMKKSGIDIEKEKELSEERTKEVLELLKKENEVNEALAKAISDFNNNIEILEIFNKNFQEMKKITKKLKKKKKEKRDPFEVIVPKNFWESILEDEDILSAD